MISLLCYVTLYYNIDGMLHNYYYNKYNYNIQSYELINNSYELSFFFKTSSAFMIIIYLYTIVYNLFISKYNDKISLALSFIYIKYLIDTLSLINITEIEYSNRRCLMWLFTTPLMLKIYCVSNNLTIWDIKIHYHVISLLLFLFFNIFDFQYSNIVKGVLYIPGLIFVYKLQKNYYNKEFTRMYVYIWTTFMIINILDITNLIHSKYIHSFYYIADIVGKFSCNVIISQHNELQYINKESMDLQSIHFFSYLIKNIDSYKNDNKILSKNCDNVIINIKDKIINQIPKTNNTLKVELLEKILPFGNDKEYIANINANIKNTHTNALVKNYEHVCILFADIVSYTELANKYDTMTVFRLLNTIYNSFDNIIKKYGLLQKIENIGDAYMVVGDIFNNNTKNSNSNIFLVKEIILLALELINEIKNIKTPDKKDLSLRIGITVGKVCVGILGNQIPRLCVVGNAVNVASRLQSTAEPDNIQMSYHIYELAREIEFDTKLEFVKKPDVFLKNIGNVTTYNIYPFQNKKIE